MMSRARFNQIYMGLSSIAQKVYDATPISERWGVNKISNELRRNGTTVDFRILGGCLTSLKQAGLIKQINGEWRREGIREVVERELIEETKSMEVIEVAQPKIETPVVVEQPLDRLGRLAQRIAELGDALKQVALEVSNTAVDLQLKMESSDEDLAKLKQLQALLKSIGA